MSHVFLPSDPTLKRLAAQVEEERNHALALEPAGDDDDQAADRAERSEPGEAFRALWSSARRDEDVLQTTQPGDNLQLFGAPAPSPALAAFTAPAAATTTTTTPETAFERRERLREQRRSLVSALARRTGEEHRVINARMNRETGAPSVTKATAEQLERANALLERELIRRGGP